ncbi:MAG: hypothetical protein AAFR38_08435 [Planctomycetota bacterium]
MTKRAMSMVVAAGLVSIVGVAALAQIGPLTPPAGPVADTEPSLASIDQRLAVLETNAGAPVATDWAAFDTAGTTVVSSAPVLIRSIIVGPSSTGFQLRSVAGGDVFALFGPEHANAGRIEINIPAVQGLQIQNLGSGTYRGVVFYEPLPAP